MECLWTFCLPNQHLWEGVPGGWDGCSWWMLWSAVVKGGLLRGVCSETLIPSNCHIGPGTLQMHLPAANWQTLGGTPGPCYWRGSFIWIYTWRQIFIYNVCGGLSKWGVLHQLDELGDLDLHLQSFFSATSIADLDMCSAFPGGGYIHTFHSCYCLLVILLTCHIALDALLGVCFSSIVWWRWMHVF